MALVNGVFSTEVLVGNAGSGLHFGLGAGGATWAHIWNRAGVPVRFHFGSTGVGTTDDPALAPGEIYRGPIPAVPGMGLGTTSITTATDDTGHWVSVTAY